MALKIIVGFVIMAATMIAGAVFYVRRYWLQYRDLKCAFNYRITDIYAAMFGCLPSILSFGSLMQRIQVSHGDLEDVLLPSIFLLIFAIYQICGLVVGRIHLDIETYGAKHTNFESATSIVTGAVLGILYFLCAMIVGLILVSLALYLM